MPFSRQWCWITRYYQRASCLKYIYIYIYDGRIVIWFTSADPIQPLLTTAKHSAIMGFQPSPTQLANALQLSWLSITKHYSSVLIIITKQSCSILIIYNHDGPSLLNHYTVTNQCQPSVAMFSHQLPSSYDWSIIDHHLPSPSMFQASLSILESSLNNHLPITTHRYQRHLSITMHHSNYY